jgi:hypothetical protein
MRRYRSILTILGLAAMMAQAPVPAAAQDLPAVGLIFDSSNSMWRQVDGEAKVSILRSSLATGFSNWSGKMEMSVMTYGQQQDESCASVDSLLPLQTLSAEKFTQAVRQTHPGKGATPLALAIETAADAIKAARHPASVVLITDGLDTCRADPCATAAALKKKAPGLSIHVIAFDAKSRDQLAGLSCMAKETGGVFFAVTNGPELDGAVEKVMAAAATPPDMAQVAENDPPSPEPEKGATDKQQADGPEETAGTAANAAQAVEQQLDTSKPVETGTLRLSATLTPETPPLDAGLVWRIFSARPDENGTFRVLERSEESSPVFQLASGDYVVHVAYGRAATAKDISLGAGETTETINLNAGALRLSAVRADGEQIPANLVTYAVYSSEQDQFGERKLILSAAEPGKVIRVNAGTYHIISQYGDANAVVRADIKVEAGKLSDAVVSHQAARVTLKLVNEAGGEALADTSWSVLTPDGDVVTESVGAFPTHILAAGSYTIIASHDGKAYSRQFDVETGRDHEVEIVTGEQE